MCLKLCDFGEAEILSQKNGTGLATGEKGTDTHLAPEMIDGSRYGQNDGSGYDEKVDIWSAGITMFKLLSGEFPYKNSSEVEDGEERAFSKEYSEER